MRFIPVEEDPNDFFFDSFSDSVEHSTNSGVPLQHTSDVIGDTTHNGRSNHSLLTNQL
jgi:hypothetical protein